MAARKIVIFLSSVRPGRMADRVAEFVKQTVSAQGMTPVMLDPKETHFELVQLPFHFMPNPDDAPQWLKDTHEKIKTADGFIIVSAEYNCSLPPALSNMMDHFPPASYRHRPVGLVGYSLGDFGGSRVLVLLRAFAAELGMLVTPTNVPIPMVSQAFAEDGTPGESGDRVAKNITKMVTELGWYVDAIKSQKEVSPPPS